MKNAVIIIPALNPDERLITYCKELVAVGFDRLLMVDDGSDEEHRKIFDELEKMPQCVIFRHAINLGKGRALKNALNCFMNMKDRDNYCGVITADADGQHTVEDVLKLQDKMAGGCKKLILGARDFDADNVPPKSKFGNKCTRTVFKMLHGVRLQDTQTGLRGIPTEIIPKYLDLFGERFEYETGMLITTAREKIGFEEVIINTVYENNNEGTHFNPIRDSFAIYKLLLGTFIKYIISSLLSFIIDIGLFKIFLLVFATVADSARIIVATVMARIFSSLFNFSVNKNVVFDTGKTSGGESRVMLVKYYVLCVLQMACSAGAVALLFKVCHIPETVIKICVDTVLFLISYQIQRRLIFKEQ